MKSAHLLSDFAENLSIGYPHSNAFAGQGRTLILGHRTEEEVSLWSFELASGERRELCCFRRETQPEAQLWSDVALDVDRLVTIADNAVWVIDLAAPGTPRLLYRAAGVDRIHPMPGIRRDGRKIVCALYTPEHSCALELDADTGASEILFRQSWWANHLHYCPFDPEWIGFSHEGRYYDVLDRVWGWHRHEAPAGRCLFDQMEQQLARTLYVGHERWSFHDRSVLIVAYGDSPGEPLGIYEAFTDGRPQRLVSGGDRDMHLDVSRDGRWVVVDTSGPYDLPGKGWENANQRSDILVIDRQSGERRFVAHTRITQHPSHPHPVFSPDGSRLYFNEAESDGTRNRVWCALNPFLLDLHATEIP